MTIDALKVEPTEGASSAAVGASKSGWTSGTHLAALGWAFTDAPTIQAYQRHTGEDVAPVFARYRQWAEENVVGPSEN